MTALPQLCATCQQQKPASLCRRFKSKTRHNAFYYVCEACLHNPPVRRQHRLNNESWPEREVRQALTGIGVYVAAEYQLDHCLFDFAVPKLRLLIEVDSRAYHSLPRQLRRDRFKDAVAAKHGWLLKRVIADSDVGLAALEAVIARRAELGR